MASVGMAVGVSVAKVAVADSSKVGEGGEVSVEVGVELSTGMGVAVDVAVSLSSGVAVSLGVGGTVGDKRVSVASGVRTGSWAWACGAARPNSPMNTVHRAAMRANVPRRIAGS